MIKQDKNVRKRLWENVISLVGSDSLLAELFEVYNSNKSIEMGYSYCEINHQEFDKVYNDDIDMIFNVSCKPGEHFSVPRLELIFKDGDDTNRRDMIYRKLKNELPNYHYRRTHTNVDGLSKIVIRRNMIPGQKFDL